MEEGVEVIAKLGGEAEKKTEREREIERRAVFRSPSMKLLENLSFPGSCLDRLRGRATASRVWGLSSGDNVFCAG